MHWKGLLNSLQFYNNAFFNQNIQTIAYIQALALIDDGQGDLGSDFQSLLAKFLDQTGLIGALKQSRPKEGVDLHSSSDD